MSKFTAPKSTALSPIELVILQNAADGLSYKDSAAQLKVAITTIYNIVGERILRKLGCDNITHAVAAALRRGLID